MDSRAYNPINVAHPGETVLDYLESFGWSQRDLSRRTGLTTKTVSEICNGKAPISTMTSLALEKVFGRPAHFWINLQSKFDEIRARTAEAERSIDWQDWLKSFPLTEMSQRGWIQLEKDSPQSNIYELFRFLGVSSPQSWEEVWRVSQISYRQTRKFKTSEHAISAWVRAVELNADELELKPYDESRLRSMIDDIKKSSRLSIDDALEKIKIILAECGVAFVLVPALPQTGISGSTRWFGSKKVIVALSLRYKTDDQIWFTLFHELGHVLMHRKQHNFILDNADETLTDGIVDPEMQKLEDEANRFAADSLIPAQLLQKFISFGIFGNESIYDFAEVIGVAPGIVVGRLQHEGLLAHHQGNKLKQRANWSFAPNEEEKI